MKKLDKVLSKATGMIDDAHDDVTKYVRKVLVKNGIPEHIANQYSATYCSGGEWILSDEFELSLKDIHLMSDEYIVQAVKENEGI
jgi:hypothetical protein